jgi:DNA polymerase alpha-associated DNA helicase A
MAPKLAKISPAAFAQTQLSLLKAEQAAEVAETTLLLSEASPSTLARAGLAILNLTPLSQRTGLGGKSVVELGLDPAVASAEKGGSDLPEHGIRTGDIVRVSEQPSGGAKKKEKSEMKGKGVEGVVTRLGERAIWVALGKASADDDEDDVPAGKLWLYVCNDRVRWKYEALIRLYAASRWPMMLPTTGEMALYPRSICVGGKC